MKIEIERSGGFAGIRKVIAIDTDKLPKSMASRIETYFSRQVDPKATYKTVTKKSNVADCYCYKISSQSKKMKQEIEFSEFDIDKELKLAVNYIFKKYQ